MSSNTDESRRAVTRSRRTGCSTPDPAIVCKWFQKMYLKKANI